jgi:hypothetical protein
MLELDECGVCGADGSSCADCAGVPNGVSVVDNCGVCDTESSNDCIQDCAGIWGGMLELDECDVCGGDCLGDLDAECGNRDCDGNCVAEGIGLDENGLDCSYVCGGEHYPDFECSTCDVIVCNPSDCIAECADSLHIFNFTLPDKFGISKIYPNPFNPVTRIEYDITEYSFVMIRVFDVQGREVAMLVGESLAPGRYSYTWDASSNASGMYFVEMIAGSGEADVFRDMRKILYLK